MKLTIMHLSVGTGSLLAILGHRDVGT